MQAGLLEFANDPYRLPRNGMQEREEALGQRKRFGQMLYAANERAPARADAVRVVGVGAGYGRASVYVRCALPVASRPSRCLTNRSEWGHKSLCRVICRSRRSFQRAESVLSWVPPVGRGSLGLMP